MSTIILYKVTTSKWVSWIVVPLLRATPFFSNYSFDKLHLNSCGFSGGSVGKESACNAGDLGLIPGLERSPGKGNSNPLQYSCMENSMDRGTWWATVHGVTKSWTWLWPSFHWNSYNNLPCLEHDDPTLISLCMFHLRKWYHLPIWLLRPKKGVTTFDPINIKSCQSSPSPCIKSLHPLWSILYNANLITVLP